MKNAMQIKGGMDPIEGAQPTILAASWLFMSVLGEEYHLFKKKQAVVWCMVHVNGTILCM